jgi:DNA polymerase (family X)
MENVTNENRQIADWLQQAADLLAAQGANPFRVSAYRHAADTVARWPESVAAIHARDGRKGLDALPGIGEGLANAIAEMVTTGRWVQLERLRGSVDAVGLFRTLPGVGRGLATRIHDTLHVDTLEALELAAHDGRLESVPGVGRRRAAAVRATLADVLGHRRLKLPAPAAEKTGGPTVALILDVDQEYREKADDGKLPTIAPRRFNPDGASWLPVLHTARGAWHFTALYSNTARAHELGRTRDWVVIYFYDDQHVEKQHTVVTETHGSLLGQRVVRGREAECRAYCAGEQHA